MEKGPFTNEEVRQALITALEEQKKAMDSRIAKLGEIAEKDGVPPNEECGRSTVYVPLDGRTKEGKQLLNSDAGVGFTRMSGRKMKGLYMVGGHVSPEMHPAVNLQNYSIHEAGAEAFAKSLKDSLGIGAFAASWRD